MNDRIAKDHLSIGKIVLWIDTQHSDFWIGEVTRVNDEPGDRYVVFWRNVFTGKMVTCTYGAELSLSGAMRIVEWVGDTEKLVDYLKLFQP